MQKSIIAKSIDNLFYCISSITICVLLVGAFTKHLLSQVILGSIIGIFIYLPIFASVDFHSKARELKRSEQKQMEDIFLTFQSTHPNKLYKFFAELFTANTSLSADIKKPLIIISKLNKPIYLIAFDFFSPTYPIERLFTALELSSPYKVPLVVLSVNFSDECIQYSKENDKIILLDKVDLYQIFKTKNLFPHINKEVVKKNRKKQFKAIFQSVNIKKFFFISIVLVALSFLTPLKIYYRTLGIISFILCLTCFMLKAPHYEQSNIDKLNTLSSE